MAFFITIFEGGILQKYELLSVFCSVSMQTIFAMAFACEYFLHFFDGMDDKWCSKYHCSVLEPPFLYPPDRQTWHTNKQIKREDMRGPFNHFATGIAHTKKDSCSFLNDILV